MLLQDLYKEANLTTLEILKMPDYIQGKDDFYGSPAFEKLYSYYYLEAQEMPYGVAKCRDGSPDEWILDKIEVICES